MLKIQYLALQATEYTAIQTGIEFQKAIRNIITRNRQTILQKCNSEQKHKPSDCNDNGNQNSAKNTKPADYHYYGKT